MVAHLKGRESECQSWEWTKVKNVRIHIQLQFLVAAKPTTLVEISGTRTPQPNLRKTILRAVDCSISISS